MSPGQNGSPNDGFLGASSAALSPEQGWQLFIENESRKRYVKYRVVKDYQKN